MNLAQRPSGSPAIRGTSVLVTGGCGFIGSHLVERLVSCGARVAVFDNLSAGVLDNLNLERFPFDLPPPLESFREGCDEYGGAFADKSLSLCGLVVELAPSPAPQHPSTVVSRDVEDGAPRPAFSPQVVSHRLTNELATVRSSWRQDTSRERWPAASLLAAFVAVSAHGMTLLTRGMTLLTRWAGRRLD